MAPHALPVYRRSRSGGQGANKKYTLEHSNDAGLAKGNEVHASALELPVPTCVHIAMVDTFGHQAAVHRQLFPLIDCRALLIDGVLE